MTDKQNSPLLLVSESSNISSSLTLWHFLCSQPAAMAVRKTSLNCGYIKTVWLPLPFWDPSWLPQGMLQLGLRLKTPSVRMKLETNSDPRVHMESLRTPWTSPRESPGPCWQRRRLQVTAETGKECPACLLLRLGEDHVSSCGHRCRKGIQARDVEHQSLCWLILGQERTISELFMGRTHRSWFLGSFLTAVPREKSLFLAFLEPAAKRTPG